MNGCFYFHKPNGAWYRILAVNCNWRPSEGTTLLMQISPFKCNWDSERLAKEASLNRIFLTNERLRPADRHNSLPEAVTRNLAWLTGIDFSLWLSDPTIDIRPLLDPSQYREDKPLSAMVEKRQINRMPRRDPNGIASLRRFLERAQIPKSSYQQAEDSCEA